MISRKPILWACLLCSLQASAQTPVKGDLQLGAGLGAAAPYSTQLKLNISTPRLTVKPFFELTGINRASSGTTEHREYTYKSSGNEYHSVQELYSKGTELRYGADAQLLLDAHNTLSAGVSNTRHSTSAYGSRQEALHGSEHSAFNSLLSDPSHVLNDLHAQAALKHTTSVKGEQWSLQYSYQREHLVEELLQNGTQMEHFDRFTNNELATDATTQHHIVKADWQRPIGQGQVLAAGARYENRLITSTEEQKLDGRINFDEDFSHRMQVGGAYAEYRLNTDRFTMNAHVEYDYTRMEKKNLNDFVPQLMMQWRMDAQNSLTFNYVRRIVRPGHELLSPAHIVGAYTLDYGNFYLTGTHINNFSLAYQLKGGKATYNAAVAHIHVNDGFNAIWMEKDNIRISTWGNEGIRRAWSLTQNVQWKPAEGTTLGAKAVVLWDKRVAEAIHMQKEHWGITAGLSLEQELFAGIELSAEGEYTEGNTVDLYSHQGHGWELEGGLKRNFGRWLTAGIHYSYHDHAPIILTQGAYTGRVVTHPFHKHAAMLTLTFHL